MLETNVVSEQAGSLHSGITRSYRESAGLFVGDAAGTGRVASKYQDYSRPPSARGGLAAAITEPKRSRAAIGAGACLCLALACLLFIYFPPHNSHPFSVDVREDNGQLRISWNAAAQTMLTILDEGHRISLATAPHQSSLTYARRSGDVTVGVGSEQVRFIGPPPPLSLMKQARTGVEVLESRTACLRAVLYSKQLKLAALEAQ